MKGPSPYATPQAGGAPSNCKGVKCFQAVCIAGYSPRQAPGACCNSCQPGGGALVAMKVNTPKLIPAADQSELMRQAGGGAGVDHGHDKGEACGLMTGCADIKCVTPFALKRTKGQCCPTCFADEAAVALDRHTSMKGPSPYAAKPAGGAPSSCKGVKCFQPVCIAGYTPGQAPGACCNSCQPSLIATKAKLIPAGDQAELMRQAGGGAGVDHGHDKGVAC